MSGRDLVRGFARSLIICPNRLVATPSSRLTTSAASWRLLRTSIQSSSSTQDDITPVGATSHPCHPSRFSVCPMLAPQSSCISPTWRNKEFSTHHKKDDSLGFCLFIHLKLYCKGGLNHLGVHLFLHASSRRDVAFILEEFRISKTLLNSLHTLADRNLHCNNLYWRIIIFKMNSFAINDSIYPLCGHRKEVLWQIFITSKGPTSCGRSFRSLKP